MGLPKRIEIKLTLDYGEATAALRGLIDYRRWMDKNASECIKKNQYNEALNYSLYVDAIADDINWFHAQIEEGFKDVQIKKKPSAG